jgi:hypothetical protein
MGEISVPESSCDTGFAALIANFLVKSRLPTLMQVDSIVGGEPGLYDMGAVSWLIVWVVA